MNPALRVRFPEHVQSDAILDAPCEVELFAFRIDHAVLPAKFNLTPSNGVFPTNRLRARNFGSTDLSMCTSPSPS